jgi:hypothetical protein
MTIKELFWTGPDGPFKIRSGTSTPALPSGKSTGSPDRAVNCQAAGTLVATTPSAQALKGPGYGRPAVTEVAGC